MKRSLLLLPLLLLPAAALTGCGAGEEKLDDRFQKAFEDQGKRTLSGQNSQNRGQALPPGATPPP